MCTHMCVGIHIYIHTHKRAHMYGCTHTRVYTCMCIYPTHSVTHVVLWVWKICWLFVRSVVVVEFVADVYCDDYGIRI